MLEEHQGTSLMRLQVKEEESPKQRSFKVQVIHSIEEVRLSWRVFICHGAVNMRCNYNLSFAYKMLTPTCSQISGSEWDAVAIGAGEVRLKSEKHVQVLARYLFALLVLRIWLSHKPLSCRSTLLSSMAFCTP